MSEQVEELAWVIERYYYSRLEYWACTNDYKPNDATAFRADHLAAIRFAREQDAAMVLSALLNNQGRVAEHMWIAPAPKEPNP